MGICQASGLQEAVARTCLPGPSVRAEGLEETGWACELQGVRGLVLRKRKLQILSKPLKSFMNGVVAKRDNNGGQRIR